jgi:NhaP-type Na+/H+ or K+/H+ antiporter
MQWHRLKRLWTDVALLAIVGTLYNAALITVVARWARGCSQTLVPDFRHAFLVRT